MSPNGITATEQQFDRHLEMVEQWFASYLFELPQEGALTTTSLHWDHDYFIPSLETIPEETTADLMSMSISSSFVFGGYTSVCQPKAVCQPKTVCRSRTSRYLVAERLLPRRSLF
mmetsp:Transcript_11313/g.22357  ORF Transcript_11313/g.22357 Transcript_11313/m.22357 type:complete len:115 (+) Transcript_11313:153-497(+)